LPFPRADDIGKPRVVAQLRVPNAVVPALHYVAPMLPTIVFFAIWMAILVFVAARLTRPV
jgi:hypothetical protein